MIRTTLTRFLFVAITTTRTLAFVPALGRKLPVTVFDRSAFHVRPASTVAGDTPATLPEFSSVDDYIEFLSTVSALPKGFATGSADGTFISVEAPALGQLKIRGTIITLTEGPTDNWAAVFTTNKVKHHI
jgi:hypothetical protein